ncbi:S9 family peptidase [Candidatus Marinimicrobia bacterium]|jgi:dipeptidyl aminopeptidase/acylaminoacyl peptidase|nr:S9 family peptidase [Candidatus Neomarinimicrobiota bacterium]|tara:strand:+ start:6986 stop:8806 length:1821 start_codon:yes stop_codon:yes gene_type:complete
MQKKAPLIPMEDFFRSPEKSSFKISPNGNHIAYMKPWKTRMNVFVMDMKNKKETRLTSSEERGLYGFSWLTDKRIGYVKDDGGNENVHFYAVNIDVSNEIDLTPFKNVQARIIDDLEDDPDHIIIGLNKRSPQVHDPYRINVNDGKMEMIAENPGNISGWMTDHDGKLRIAITNDGVNTSILHRKLESDKFESILTTDFKVSVSPLFFTFDNKNLYVASNRGQDKSGIFKFDLINAKEGKLIFEHDEVDVSGLMYSRKRKVLTGVSYTVAKNEMIFFDTWREDIQEKLEEKLPGYEVGITSFSKDETKAVVVSYSDKSRGTYYYYDVEKNKLTELGKASPWLNENHMAEMTPIKYTSRDGLTIHGYLTLPENSNGKNLPLVVNPHGGPWARDTWGYNPQIQFLANRGFAVLQMNFRGSTGYGREFWEISFKEWGKSMQDDITDGVKWLIDEGIADPNRIAIYGASYGGYATLAGLAFTPDLYACGVDYVGVSNIFTLLETLPPYWELGRQMMYEMIGNPETERDLLEAASPIFHVDSIRVPLFVAQGANDPRVKQSESDQIVEALKARGVEVPYMLKEDEGHGFYNEENQFDFYREMEKFLNKHIN